MTPESGYFDSSAVVKLLIPEEQGAEQARVLLRRPIPHYTSLLTYPEAHSALSRRFRARELSEERLQDALAWLLELWREFNVLPPELSYFTHAADLVLRHPLSGADAVHLASALQIPSTNVTFVTWDRQQAAAARALGLDVQPSASA